ncbi:MAG TPA: DUF72 domain-containing protein [Candidatus Binatia bacterium]|nr:DUF72 domain-containing protein [Candidatus Binatia bacterium]
MSRHGALRIGTSGYHYDHWKGVFYPKNLPKDSWFSHYAGQFDTVEINNTFYRLPEATTFEGWRRQAPKGFCYALKFSRYGSHIVRLKKPRDTIGKFLKRADRLGEFLGPILVQLPPNWKADPGRLAAFLAAAPKDHRWAVEFRDPRWLCDEVFAILNQAGTALCIHDMIANHPRLVTAGWVYLRFHGEHYSGSYSSEKLRAESRWIKQQLADGKNVFVYFNNDAQGYAVENALELRRYLEGV